MYSPLFYISLCVDFCECVHTAFTQILEQFAHKTVLNLITLYQYSVYVQQEYGRQILSQAFLL